jgi:sulfur carrier protein ThiS
MRMHRGSSKDARAVPGAPENLPLSASSARLPLVVELTRASTVARRRLTVATGTTVKDVLRNLGEPPEGCAVMIDSVPVPLDTPLDRPTRLVVVSTFSGG